MPFGFEGDQLPNLHASSSSLHGNFSYHDYSYCVSRYSPNGWWTVAGDHPANPLLKIYYQYAYGQMKSVTVIKLCGMERLCWNLMIFNYETYNRFRNVRHRNFSWRKERPMETSCLTNKNLFTFCWRLESGWKTFFNTCHRNMRNTRRHKKKKTIPYNSRSGVKKVITDIEIFIRW